MKTVQLRSEDHWRELRHQHIGGSEIAALFGEHGQVTRFELWHRKKGLLPEPDLSDNERVFWGSVLEPAIAEGVRQKTGWTVRKVRRYHSRLPELALGGSLDYEIIAHDRGPGILEIKTADWLVMKNWPDGEPPLSYELQLQGYMACTGRSWGAMAVLVGGNDLRLFEYQRRPRTIATIEAEVAAFWESIKKNEMPAPNFEMDADAISKLYRGVGANKMVDLTEDNRLQAACAEYKDVSARLSVLDGEKTALRAEIALKVLGALQPNADEPIGKGARVICGPFTIPAWSLAETEIAFTRKASADFRVNEKKDATA